MKISPVISFYTIFESVKILCNCCKLLMCLERFIIDLQLQKVYCNCSFLPKCYIKFLKKSVKRFYIFYVYKAALSDCFSNQGFLVMTTVYLIFIAFIDFVFKFFYYLFLVKPHF